MLRPQKGYSRVLLNDTLLNFGLCTPILQYYLVYVDPCTPILQYYLVHVDPCACWPLYTYSTVLPCTCWPLYTYSTVLPVHVDRCTPILQYYLYILALYTRSTVLPVHVDPSAADNGVGKSILLSPAQHPGTRTNYTGAYRNINYKEGGIKKNHPEWSIKLENRQTTVSCSNQIMINIFQLTWNQALLIVHTDPYFT